MVLEIKVVPRLKRMGLKVLFYSYYAKSDHVWKWCALVYSKELYTAVQKLTEKVAKYFDSLQDEDAKQFIAGLFDAEGTKTDRIVI